MGFLLLQINKKAQLRWQIATFADFGYLKIYCWFTIVMPEKGEACRKSEKFNVVTASLTKCKINITSHKKAETAITGTKVWVYSILIIFIDISRDIRYSISRVSTSHSKCTFCSKASVTVCVSVYRPHTRCKMLCFVRCAQCGPLALVDFLKMAPWFPA